ncbi:MAG: tRNA-dihydrouridine synthase [Synergistes sp.]|nr:tRNA-dihydrouridine synthase [Synergistes sp.]
MQSNGTERYSPTIPNWPRTIGGVETENPIWLAPLAGITFASFRKFHRKLGAGLVHTEMISALGLKYNGRKTKELLYGSDEESPCVLQLFGSCADDIECGAEIALGIREFAAVEINMACPMPKVTKKGSGSALMKKPEEAEAIIRTLKKFGLPVWAKVRIIGGSSERSEEFCERLFENGADFIFVHGRTPEQRYEGSASRYAVEKIAQTFPGKIGGSGDCYTAEDFRDYLDRGCASVLAARGVLRDAFLIPKTLRSLGAEVPEKLCDPSAEAQAAILSELGNNIYNTEGGSLALTIARRMLSALFKGFPGASQLRRTAATVKSWPEMDELLKNSGSVMMRQAQTEEAAENAAQIGE